MIKEMRVLYMVLNRLNKKAMTISILLLVLLTLLVVSTSLFYFITEKTSINKKINTIGFSEDVFDREILLNNYLQSLVEENSKGVKSEEEFIDRMKNALSFESIPVDIFIMDESGKIIFPEYTSIISSLNTDNVELSSEGGVLKSVIFKTEFDIDSRENKANGQGIFHLKYHYSKELIGVI